MTRGGTTERAMAALAAGAAAPRFGDVLRHWRAVRRLSQLALAGEAGISTRHLSFLETGRAQPPGVVAQVPGPPNVVRMTFHPQGLRRYIVNWEALAGPLVQQIHREAVGGVPDEGTRRLRDEILAYPGVPAGWRTPDAHAQSAPFLPMVLRKGDLALRFFTTIATLGTPQDITLQELRVECFFPGDDATEAFARRLATPASAMPAASS